MLGEFVQISWQVFPGLQWSKYNAMRKRQKKQRNTTCFKSVQRWLKIFMSTDQSLEMDSSELFARKLLKMCPDTFGLLPPNSDVKFLEDGRILIDDGHKGNVYHKGFCLEYFSDRQKRSLTISAFICKSTKPDLTFPSLAPIKKVHLGKKISELPYSVLLKSTYCWGMWFSTLEAFWKPNRHLLIFYKTFNWVEINLAGYFMILFYLILKFVQCLCTQLWFF